MSTPLEASGLLMKLAFGVASATVLGGGSMLLGLHRNDAVQDEKLVHVQHTVAKIDSLDEKLNTTLRSIDVLNARLQLTEAKDGSRNR